MELIRLVIQYEVETWPLRKLAEKKSLVQERKIVPKLFGLTDDEDNILPNQNKN